MSGGRATIAVHLAVVSLLAGACRSPVPFHGRPGPDAPILALGGPVPYVRPYRRPPPPMLDQRGDLPDRLIDIYAATRAGMPSRAPRGLPARVYVPEAAGAVVDVLDAVSGRVIRRIPAGRAPQQVVPSWDLKTLWVTEPAGLVPIDPRTGRRGRTVPVPVPSDLYFSMDGHDALVMGARSGRIEIRDPRTMRARSVIRVPCPGLTRADLSAGGSTLVVGCAGAGKLARVDLTRHRVTRMLRLAPDARPQDVRLSPDGTTFYVADMGRGGVWTIDARRFAATGFIATGRGAHGLYPSRDATTLYVTDSGERTVSLISFAQRRKVGGWRLPAAPDMAGVSADGGLLWLSAHGDNAVYAVSTRTGRPVRRIPAGPGPHGLCVYPQPGRFSLGHTGNYR